MSDPHARIREAAEARGLEVEIRERPAANSLQEAADILGIPPSGIVKTLVVKRSDDTYLFALVPGGRAISWPKLRALVGLSLPMYRTMPRKSSRAFGRHSMR